MTVEEHRHLILDSLEEASRVNYTDAKQCALADAMTCALMWIAEELHELNERSKDG